MPSRCACCGTFTARLSLAFTNGMGWRLLCRHCCDPETGPARPYLGPYPVTTFKAARPALRVITGDARQ